MLEAIYQTLGLWRMVIFYFKAYTTSGRELPTGQQRFWRAGQVH